ncbi:MAG: ABC transporter transmembrane domain-containing protein [Pseudonocardiaceae bacterium]
MATVLTQDLQTIQSVTSEILPQVVGAAIAPLVLLAITFLGDWRLGLATLATLVLAVPVHLWTQRRFLTLARVRQQRQAEAVARILEYVEWVPVIRAYNQVGERLVRFREALDACRAANLQLVHRLAPLLHTVKATIEAGFAVVLLAAIYLYVGGEVATLTVIAFLVLTLRIYQPIVAQAEALRIADGSMERVAAVLDTVPQAQPSADRARRPESHDIAFDHVRFAYDAGAPQENPVLRDVTLGIPQGSLTPLVGPSGAGKSTVGRLIARFWEVQAGMVSMGGSTSATSPPTSCST